MDKFLGISKSAIIPKYHNRPLRKRKNIQGDENHNDRVSKETSKKTEVGLFCGCYGNYNIPEVGEDLIKVFEYNGIGIKFLEGEKCCGMPKFEMGDIEAVMKLKDESIGFLYEFVKGGRDIVSLMPSCTFILKEKWRLLFEDEKVKELSRRIYDPCEYLIKKYREKDLNLDFKKGLGKIVYHFACHTRAQNVGVKAVELFRLVEGVRVEVVDRCFGHDGAYGLKSEFYKISEKICRPVVNQVKRKKPDYYSSDCALAGNQIGLGLSGEYDYKHPMSLMRIAYGL